jgi:hypothetical protein
MVTSKLTAFGWLFAISCASMGAIKAIQSGNYALLIYAILLASMFPYKLPN